MITRLVGLCAVSVALAGAALAESQVWNDSGADNVWSTNAPNWEAGAVWTNGNSAVFAGLGETVDVGATVTVANVTFQTNGYVIADVNKDGSLSVVGAPSVITVVNVGDTGIVSAAIGGSGGFIKAGSGVLQLKGTNTYTGVTTVAEGILRLNPNTLAALGASGTGNETVVLDGATLDANSAWSANVNEDITISGSGVGGIGAIVNNGPTPYYNVGLRNLTLSGDATIGGSQRFDLSGSGSYVGNGHTLTKAGSFELAILRAIANSPIVINAGTYTIQLATALGSTDYPTTLNGGRLQTWGSYTLSERLYVNGGTLSASGTGAQTFTLSGNMTLNSNVVVQTETSITNTLVLAGVMDGAGGFTRAGSGFVIVTGDANTYAGPTIVNSGSRLWVGSTVGGTGVLGTGTATNNGTLYANSATLSAGTVVNASGGALYLNPPTLNAGRIITVSGGTVYGTSVVQATSGVVNGGTWNSYSGSFGSSAVTNAAGGTLNLYTNVLAYGQFANGGTLSVWQSMTLPDPITFIGGTLYVNDLSNTLYVTGPVTLAGNASFSGTGSSVTEVSGALSGPGGAIRSGDGWCYILNDGNTYTGPTIINDSKRLFVGKAGVYSTGSLGSGAITNYGSLFFDQVGSYEIANGINGYGTTFIRYGASVTVNGKVSTNNVIRISHGSLSLINGAALSVPVDFTVADRQTVSYSTLPVNSPLVTNITAIINVAAGCSLTVSSMTFGNGGDLPGGIMTGILNQVGGVVRTTGATAEENGIRLGHYPMARGFYNMMGGTLTVGANYDLCCATDGQGWFNMTGGEVYTKRVMLNERDSAAGYGRLTVSGGTLNVGSLTGSTVALSNGICADVGAPYLVELGGAGGTIRAVTNIFLPLDTTLYGADTNAITFDSQAYTISLSGVLSGSGGFTKTGSGVLVLSGTNTYSGATRVLEGQLIPASDKALPAGGVVEFGVSIDGSGGQLYMPGDLSLAGLIVGVANPEALDTHKNYTIATYGGAVTGVLAGDVLPEPWYVYRDVENKRVQLRAAIGTMIRLK